MIDEIQAILDGASGIVVAKDSDYSDLLNSKYVHHRILYTYGYSIENTLYCPSIIASIIERYCKDEIDLVDHVGLWYEKFVNNLKDLLVYDFANMKFDKGIEGGVMGNKSPRFLASNNSPNLSGSQIKRKIKEIKDMFTEEEFNECQQLIDDYDKNLRYIIRGHFLTNAVLNLVKTTARKRCGKETTISLEAFYESIIDGCLVCGSTDSCADVLFLINSVKQAIEEEPS
jgi:hypothetical protein